MIGPEIDALAHYRQHQRVYNMAASDSGLALRNAAAKNLPWALQAVLKNYHDTLDVNSESKSNRYTALMHAVERGHDKCAMLLMAHPKVARLRAQEVLKKHASFGAQLLSAKFQINSDEGWPLRFPHLYAHLADPARRLPQSPKVLIIGPGHEAAGSHQLAELCALLPEGHFDVLDKSEKICTIARQHGGWAPQHHKQVADAFAHENNTDLARAVPADVQKRLLDGLKSPPSNPIHVWQANALGWDYPFETYDVVVATQCLFMAKEEFIVDHLIAHPHEPPNHSPVGSMYVRILDSLKVGGYLYTDEAMKEELLEMFDLYREQQNIAEQICTHETVEVCVSKTHRHGVFKNAHIVYYKEREQQVTDPLVCFRKLRCLH